MDDRDEVEHEAIPPSEATPSLDAPSSWAIPVKVPLSGFVYLATMSESEDEHD